MKGIQIFFKSPFFVSMATAFQNGRRCHGNGQNAKKHKNDDSRLLAEQKLMKLDRNNMHI
jgi:hypothetical protein